MAQLEGCASARIVNSMSKTIRDGLARRLTHRTNHHHERHTQGARLSHRRGSRTRLQAAGAYALTLPPAYYERFSKSITARRDQLLPVLQGVGFQTFRPDGAYYIMTDISAFGFASDVEFTRHLIREIGVACVPGSSFYSLPERGAQQVRFCFCKQDATLLAAAERLGKLQSRI